jgi:hypothetical protein
VNLTNTPYACRDMACTRLPLSQAINLKHISNIVARGFPKPICPISHIAPLQRRYRFSPAIGAISNMGIFQNALYPSKPRLRLRTAPIPMDTQSAQPLVQSLALGCPVQCSVVISSYHMSNNRIRPPPSGVSGINPPRRRVGGWRSRPSLLLPPHSALLYRPQSRAHAPITHSGLLPTSSATGSPDRGRGIPFFATPVPRSLPSQTSSRSKHHHIPDLGEIPTPRVLCPGAGFLIR